MIIIRPEDTQINIAVPIDRTCCQESVEVQLVTENNGGLTYFTQPSGPVNVPADQAFAFIPITIAQPVPDGIYTLGFEATGCSTVTPFNIPIYMPPESGNCDPCEDLGDQEKYRVELHEIIPETNGGGTFTHIYKVYDPHGCCGDYSDPSIGTGVVPAVPIQVFEAYAIDPPTGSAPWPGEYYYRVDYIPAVFNEPESVTLVFTSPCFNLSYDIEVHYPLLSADCQPGEELALVNYDIKEWTTIYHNSFFSTFPDLGVTQLPVNICRECCDNNLIVSLIEPDIEQLYGIDENLVISSNTPLITNWENPATAPSFGYYYPQGKSAYISYLDSLPSSNSISNIAGNFSITNPNLDPDTSQSIDIDIEWVNSPDVVMRFPVYIKIQGCGHTQYIPLVDYLGLYEAYSEEECSGGLAIVTSYINNIDHPQESSSLTESTYILVFRYSTSCCNPDPTSLKLMAQKVGLPSPAVEANTFPEIFVVELANNPGEVVYQVRLDNNVDPLAEYNLYLLMDDPTDPPCLVTPNMGYVRIKSLELSPCYRWFYTQKSYDSANDELTLEIDIFEQNEICDLSNISNIVLTNLSGNTRLLSANVISVDPLPAPSGATVKLEVVIDLSGTPDSVIDLRIQDTTTCYDTVITLYPEVYNGNCPPNSQYEVTYPYSVLDSSTNEITLGITSEDQNAICSPGPGTTINYPLGPHPEIISTTITSIGPNRVDFDVVLDASLIPSTLIPVIVSDPSGCYNHITSIPVDILENCPPNPCDTLPNEASVRVVSSGWDPGSERFFSDFIISDPYECCTINPADITLSWVDGFGWSGLIDSQLITNVTTHQVEMRVYFNRNYDFYSASSPFYVIQLSGGVTGCLTVSNYSYIPVNFLYDRKNSATIITCPPGQMSGLNRADYENGITGLPLQVSLYYRNTGAGSAPAVIDPANISSINVIDDNIWDSSGSSVSAGVSNISLSGLFSSPTSFTSIVRQNMAITFDIAGIGAGNLWAFNQVKQWLFEVTMTTGETYGIIIPLSIPD